MRWYLEVALHSERLRGAFFTRGCTSARFDACPVLFELHFLAFENALLHHLLLTLHLGLHLLLLLLHHLLLPYALRIDGVVAKTEAVPCSWPHRRVLNAHHLDAFTAESGSALGGALLTARGQALSHRAACKGVVSIRRVRWSGSLFAVHAMPLVKLPLDVLWQHGPRRPGCQARVP